MAARGRGRGAFRGGRGGRGAPMGPVARDDDGTVLKTEFEGPPPLFPEVDQPPLLELNDFDEDLLVRRSDLSSGYKRSAYSIEPPKAKDAASVDVERYSDRYTKRRRREKPLLSATLTLDPWYFPAELFSEKERRAATRAQSTTDVFKPASPTANAGRGLLKALNQWEDREARAAEGGAGAAGIAEKEGEGPEDEDAAVEADEDDEEIMDDDDYYQGQHFDDDEGYDDYGDDGGGDEAYY